MYRAGRPAGPHRRGNKAEKTRVQDLKRLASYYQIPTLERLKLLSIVNRTAEPPRSEIACDK